MPVLGAVMPIEALDAEAGRIDREITFDRPKRQAACGYQALDDRRDLLGLDHVEDTVVARRVGDEALRLGLAQIGHEAAPADGGVDLEGGRKERVADAQPGTPTQLFRFRDRIAQVAQQVTEDLFLACLGCVVCGPVLRIGNAYGGCDRGAAVFIGLTLHRELDGKGVLALHLAQFVIWARTVIAVIAQGYGVSAIERLRGNGPFVALFHDLRRCRNFDTPLFSCVHCHLLVCTTIVGTIGLHSQLG